MIPTRSSPVKRKMRPARRRKRLRPGSKKPSTGLFLLGLLALLVLYLWARDNIPPLLVRTCTAEPGFIERTVSTDAIIIRQETVFAAPVSGKLVLRVKEGERVRAGMPIVEISNPRASRVIDDQINQVNQKLAEFDRLNGSRILSLEKACRDLGLKIRETVAEARKSAALGDYERLLTLDLLLRDTVQKRAEAAADLERLDTLRNEIVAERQRLADIAKKANNVVEAPSPGVVSFWVDGLEKAFSTVKTEGISPRAVFTAQPKPAESRTGDEVKAGKPLFRIVVPDQVYMALPLPANDLGDVVASQAVRVRSDALESKIIPARVVSVTDPGSDGFGVVVVSLSSCPEEALRLRKIRVDLIKDRHEGLVIPQKCLTEKNGETGVYIVYKTMAYFRKVTIKAQDNGKVVVEGISPGVEVITNHWLVHEGLKVR